MVLNVQNTGNGPFDPDLSPVRNRPLASATSAVAIGKNLTGQVRMDHAGSRHPRR
jgi:hypothetical protein